MTDSVVYLQRFIFWSSIAGILIYLILGIFGRSGTKKIYIFVGASYFVNVAFFYYNVLFTTPWQDSPYLKIDHVRWSALLRLHSVLLGVIMGLSVALKIYEKRRRRRLCNLTDITKGLTHGNN